DRYTSKLHICIFIWGLSSFSHHFISESTAETKARAMQEQMKIGSNGDYFICNASIVGNNNRIWGHRNSVTGNGNEVCGNCNTVVGNDNIVKGLNNNVVGTNNSIVDQQQPQPPRSPNVSVNICNRTRVRIDSQGRRSCENFHVELIEHGPGDSGNRQNS
uniref:Pectate lyase n=1 Tax=Macrostomum lignano TaxID=282301 RepID=A0A1I8H3F5_9PLAT